MSTANQFRRTVVYGGSWGCNAHFLRSMFRSNVVYPDSVSLRVTLRRVL